ncbi:MAG TPA: hypothetical protein VGD64_03225 [Acidisarcina sp.]
MTRRWILLVLAFVGSAVCWWPSIIEPSLDFPRWILPVLVALIVGASILLWGRRGWLASVAAAGAGSFAGLLTGVFLWPASDGIARSYALVGVAIATAAAAGSALLGGLAAFFVVRRKSISNGTARAALWVVLALCLAFGPTLFALTKPLVQRRVARNESIAAVRFASLKKAVEHTRAGGNAAASICDGQSLQRHYSGPPFTNEDWSRICGNYVEEDKYVYMISCRPQGRYRLEARPKMPTVYGYGVRTLCADESGEIACALWRNW